MIALVVASPQLIAMIVQAGQGGASAPADRLAKTYGKFGIGLPTLFSPSPRLDYWHLGLSRLTADYVYAQPHEALATFGFVLTITALAGLAVSWRRQSGLRWMALLWAVGAVLALGTTLTIGKTTLVPLAARWHGVMVSQLMPYTWLIRIPGLSALREPDRLALLGLMGAAVLAGAAVQWLSQHARPLIAVVAVAAFLEAGWAGTGALMPITMPAVDQPIAADHSRSIVVDVPFGLRGGILLRGLSFPAQALMLAVEDGHPRAVSYTSWVPQPTSHGIIVGHAFYRCLGSAQVALAKVRRGPAGSGTPGSGDDCTSDGYWYGMRTTRGRRWASTWRAPDSASAYRADNGDGVAARPVVTGPIWCTRQARRAVISLEAVGSNL